MEVAVPLIVALLLVVIAWKLFKGVAKTVALVAILVLAALYVYQTGGFA